MSGRWASSSRRSELPADWPTIRRRILERDPFCRLNLDGCTTRSTEVDHVDDKHDHHDRNLRGVCHDCHAKRTQEQAREATRLKGRKRPRREPHPGRLT